MRWLVRALFFFILIGGLAPMNASAEPRLALVIANSAYAGGLDPLANPVNDGKLIAGVLQKLGFTVTLVTDADQKKMKRAVSDFGEALGDAGPTASALFYYAGHGLQVDGQNYLIPINADIRREADVDLEAVSAEAVLKQMEYAAPSTSIVILDACRNNPLSRGFRSATRGLARMDAPNGSYVAYSTAPGQTAADGAGKNSPFATALVAEIMKPGQGIEESFRNVRVNVSKATNGEQTPWDSSSLMSSFYFAGEKQQTAVAAAPGSAPVAPTPAAPAPATTSLDPAELAVWESIKNSSDPGDYAAYLRKYPTGTFAEVAASRQKGLEDKAASRTAVQVAAVTPAPAAPMPVEAGPVEPGPAIESPLPDGTIVLSHKVTEALRAYLSETYPNVDYGTGQVAYFAVSKDGQSFGQTACMMSDGKACSKIAGGSPIKAKARATALSKCQSHAKSECVILFVGESDKAKYKTFD